MSSGAPRPLPALGGAWVERPGRVVSVDAGVVLVRLATATVRTTLGAALLARVAADRACGPRPGDRVLTRWWVDNRCTVERVVARPLPGA